MNDRFRFRAWHKPTKKMFEVFCFTDEEVFENTIDGVGARQTNPANIDDCVLMQSTGLKDKNGKLIYEGDIVRVAQLSTNLPVVYDLKFATFELLSYKYCVSLHGSDENLEVIGNIHENPELLEVEK